jgi:hypothetical protein
MVLGELEPVWVAGLSSLLCKAMVSLKDYYFCRVAYFLIKALDNLIQRQRGYNPQMNLNLFGWIV